jgi:hypothetical protein
MTVRPGEARAPALVRAVVATGGELRERMSGGDEEHVVPTEARVVAERLGAR